MVAIARAHCLPELSEEAPARSVPLVSCSAHSCMRAWGEYRRGETRFCSDSGIKSNTMSSPTATTLMSTNDQQPFSQQDIQLDDISLSTLRSLSSLCYEFRQSISHPALERIKIGPPKAGHLGPIIRDYSSRFATIADQCDCQQIFIRYSHLPGVRLLQRRLNELQQTLEAGFDDTSTGYAQRVHILEKLNYENGKVAKWCGGHNH